MGPFGVFGRDPVDAWWNMVLGNRERMEELARSLRGLGRGSGNEPGVSHEDLSAVIEALTLVEERLDRLDVQVKTLAGSMTQMVQLMERTHGADSEDGP